MELVSNLCDDQLLESLDALIPLRIERAVLTMWKDGTRRERVFTYDSGHWWEQGVEPVQQ